MTREQYIERLIAIFKLRYKPSQEEIEEFKLLMEMMPDRPILTVPNWPKPDPIEPPKVVMYGDKVSSSVRYTTTGKIDEKS